MIAPRDERYQPPCPSQRIISLMLRATEALYRCSPVIGADPIAPADLAYIDNQCEKAIRWLSSVRAIAVSHSQIDPSPIGPREAWEIEAEAEIKQIFDDVEKEIGGDA